MPEKNYASNKNSILVIDYLDDLILLVSIFYESQYKGSLYAAAIYSQKIFSEFF